MQSIVATVINSRFELVRSYLTIWHSTLQLIASIYYRAVYMYSSSTVVICYSATYRLLRYAYFECGLCSVAVEVPF